MAYPFSTEGEVVVDVVSPAKAKWVIAGVEQWLSDSGAQRVYWEENKLRFRDTPSHNMAYRRSPIRGLDGGWIEFREDGGKIVLNYRISFSFALNGLVMVLAFPMSAVMGAPSLVKTLCILPLFAVALYSNSLSLNFQFRGALRAAAIRTMRAR